MLMLIIGNSLIRQEGLSNVYKGDLLERCPGGRIKHIKERLTNYIHRDLLIICIYVSTNNLRRGYRGPGYNGERGEKEALQSVSVLFFCLRLKIIFPLYISQDLCFGRVELRVGILAWSFVGCQL